MQPVFDIDSYNSRLDSLFERFQSVQKTGFTPDSYKPGLSGMERFSALLGDPWKEYPCIHVAGTNGKGSVCSMLASALATGCGGLAGGYPRRAKGRFRATEKVARIPALPVRKLPLQRRSWNSQQLSGWTSEGENLSPEEIHEEEVMLLARTALGPIPEKDWFIADDIIPDLL